MAQALCLSKRPRTTRAHATCCACRSSRTTTGKLRTLRIVAVTGKEQTDSSVRAAERRQYMIEEEPGALNMALRRCEMQRCPPSLVAHIHQRFLHTTSPHVSVVLNLSVDKPISVNPTKSMRNLLHGHKVSLEVPSSLSLYLTHSFSFSLSRALSQALNLEVDPADTHVQLTPMRQHGDA